MLQTSNFYCNIAEKVILKCFKTKKIEVNRKTLHIMWLYTLTSSNKKFVIYFKIAEQCIIFLLNSNLSCKTKKKLLVL